MHPLVNSRQPVKITCTVKGNRGKSHFFRMNNNTRKITTHAEIIAIVLVEDSISFTGEMVELSLLGLNESGWFIKKCPVNMADEI